MNRERYIVQIDFYIWAKTDSKAVKLANWIAKKLCRRFDNQARITGLWSRPYGSLEPREVDYEG